MEQCPTPHPICVFFFKRTRGEKQEHIQKSEEEKKYLQPLLDLGIAMTLRPPLFFFFFFKPNPSPLQITPAFFFRTITHHAHLPHFSHPQI